MQDQFFVLAPLDGFIGFEGAYQPCHAVDGFDAVVAGPRGLVRAKSDITTQLPRFYKRRQRRHHKRIVAVEQHQSVTENA